MPLDITLSASQPTANLTDGFDIYLNNMNCATTITSPPGSIVIFNMTFIDVASQDQVTFYDGNSTSSKVLAEMSGSLPPHNPVVQSTSSAMTVGFITDFIVEQTGFFGLVGVCVCVCE